MSSNRVDCDLAFKQALESFNFEGVAKFLQDYEPARGRRFNDIDSMKAWCTMLYYDLDTDKCHSRVSSGCFSISYFDWGTSKEIKISYELEFTWQQVYTEQERKDYGYQN